jgi:hypothetical protein
MSEINKIKRSIGTLMTTAGLMQIRQAINDLATEEIYVSKIKESCNKLGIGVNELDFTFRTTSWQTWEQIIPILYGIIKEFKWESDIFDCDDRASFMTSLCSLLFRVNTLASAYCEVYDATTGKLKYLHWANVVIDRDAQLYLLDVDQSGMIQKITSNNLIMGVNKYHILQLRLY